MTTLGAWPPPRDRRVGQPGALLRGTRSEDCPPGLEAGDPISPPRDSPEQVGFKKDPAEAVSTRFGGNGAVVFFGLAKPVRTPMIGPSRSQ